ncbi:hypothetical protein [Ornithinibacillus xuwenensis]|uniref:DUF4352 domain-containing protein n=1 Tax=Ornithinibacillus xuwenensis TaxID=3144668 RepID=A0ABU9XI90_9BACI
MKRMSIYLLAALLLVGCSDDQDTSNTDLVEKEVKSTVKQTSYNPEKYRDNPQAPATDSLTEVGQVFRDEDGKVELMAITDDKVSTTIGPINFQLSDVKVLDFTPAYHLIDYFHGLTHQETNFLYVKLQVTITNNADQIVDFAPVSVIETNQGEQKSFEDDFYLQSLNGPILAGDSKTGELAFILEETDISELTKLSITTSNVFTEDKEELAEGKKIAIEF